MTHWYLIVKKKILKKIIVKKYKGNPIILIWDIKDHDHPTRYKRPTSVRIPVCLSSIYSCAIVSIYSFIHIFPFNSTTNFSLFIPFFLFSQLSLPSFNFTPQKPKPTISWNQNRRKQNRIIVLKVMMMTMEGMMDKAVLDDVITRLLEGKGGKQVQLSEGEIRQLCINARQIFLSQPILLDLHAPIRICG